MAKFIIRTHLGSKFIEMEVEGEIVFEMYGHQFFCRREDFNVHLPRFVISEASTGFKIGEPNTSRDAAIHLAKELLRGQGEMNFIAGMNKAKEIIKLNFNMFT